MILFISQILYTFATRSRDLVTMDEDTYKALNIVQARDHPSLFKFGETITTMKGVSLFSLLNRYCHSRPGVQFLW